MAYNGDIAQWQHSPGGILDQMQRVLSQFKEQIEQELAQMHATIGDLNGRLKAVEVAQAQGTSSIPGKNLAEHLSSDSKEIFEQIHKLSNQVTDVRQKFAAIQQNNDESRLAERILGNLYGQEMDEMRSTQRAFEGDPVHGDHRYRRGLKGATE